MGVVKVSPLTGLCQENWPLSYVILVRATYCTIGLGQYTLLSSRPVLPGQVMFEFKFTTGIECGGLDNILKLQNLMNWIFDTNWNIYIIYLFVTFYHVCMFIDICKGIVNQFYQKILHTSGQIFSRKVLFGWSEGTALLNNCFGPCIHYTKW